MSNDKPQLPTSLETFPNPRPGVEYEIEIVCPEFTSVCPRTGLPDYGTLTFRYRPGLFCVELKSLKVYLNAYRNVGAFYEALTNTIFEDFVTACSPEWCTLHGEFSVRGGIRTNVRRHYAASPKHPTIRETPQPVSPL